MYNKRKQLSLLLMLTLVFSMSMSTAGAVAEALHVNAEEYSIVLPNLEGLESVQPPGEKAGDCGASGVLQELNLDHLPGTPVSGTPFMLDIPADALPLLRQGRSDFALFALPQEPKVGDEQIIILNPSQDAYGDKVVTVVAAIGKHCIIYVDKDYTVNGSAAAEHFQPIDTTPHENAKKIADEFDNVIYPMITKKFGDPVYLDNTSEKIKLVLYDIHKDGEDVAGPYFAGYFDMINFFDDPVAAPTSNADTIISIDIGTTQGYFYFSNEDGQTTFFGTMAHELQHLINFSEWLEKNQLPVPAGDPDAGRIGSSLWLNEGLSGLADTMYLKHNGYKMTQGYIDNFLTNNFKEYVGCVPTSGEWYSTAGTQMLSVYGSSSVILQEYDSYRKDVSALVQSDEAGYYGSKRTVSMNFYEGDKTRFNDFFDLVQLNVNVDTPGGKASTGEYVSYYTDIVDNSWTYRANLSYFAKPLTSNTAVSTGGRAYYTELYLAPSAKAGYSEANITIPEGSKAVYYIITPYNTANIVSDEDWYNTAKIAGKLNTGLNTVQVGTNNMFAILAIAHEYPINESITYTPGNISRNVSGIAVKSPPKKTVYEAGEPLDLSGLIISLTRDDNSTEQIAITGFAAKGLTTSPSNGESLTESDTEITITHSDAESGTHSTTWPIIVTPADVSHPGVSFGFGINEIMTTSPGALRITFNTSVLFKNQTPTDGDVTDKDLINVSSLTSGSDYSVEYDGASNTLSLLFKVKLTPGMAYTVSTTNNLTDESSASLVGATRSFIVRSDKDIISVWNPTPITVASGTTVGSVPWPATVAIILNNGETQDIAVVWDKSNYKSTSGVYTVIGALSPTGEVTNDTGITAELTVTVKASNPTDPTNPGGNGGSGNSGGGGSSGSTTPPITDTSNTSKNQETIEKLLNSGNPAEITVSGSNNSVMLNVATVDALVKANEPLTIKQGGLSVTIPPEVLKSFESIGGNVQIIIEPLTNAKVSELLKAGLAAGGDITLAAGIVDIKINVGGKEQKEYSVPLKITLDITSASLAKGKPAKLTGVRLNENGTINKLGGAYDGKTRKFTFHTSRTSKYSVMFAENLVSLYLTLNSGSYTLNDEKKIFDVAPVVKDDRTLVPIRLIAESFGADVRWDGINKTVTITLDGKALYLTINQKLPGMDVPAQILNDRTMVPLRFISEYFDANVVYDNGTRTISIYR